MASNSKSCWVQAIMKATMTLQLLSTTCFLAFNGNNEKLCSILQVTDKVRQVETNFNNEVLLAAKMW